MFDGEFHSLIKDFSPLIKCHFCQSKVKEAKILLCGLFCNDCVADLEKNANHISREFRCPSCNEIHTIPQNGFKTWKALNEFYPKESSLEKVFRGETAEKLKRNLKEIKIQIDYLDFSLKNSVDAVKQCCLNLRNEISLQAQMVIKQIQDMRDELVQEVIEYEKKCNSNILDKQEIERSLSEIRDFHKEWSEYLKRYQINETDMVKANRTAFELQSKLKEEKLNFEKLIFNNKSISFKRNQIQLDKNFLGNLHYKEIGEIDFNKFHVFNLTDILSKLDNCYARHIDIDSFETGKLAVVYPDISNRVSIAIIDKNRMKCKSTQSFFLIGTIHWKIKFNTIKDILVIFHMDDHGINYMSFHMDDHHEN